MNKNENVNAVENAKVANVAYKFYSVDIDGFLKDGDTLVSVTVSSVRIDLKKQLITSVLKDVNEKEYVREGDYGLYPSTQAFEKEEPMARSCYRTYELLQYADWPRTYDCSFHVLDEDKEKSTSNVYLEIWVFENGEAKSIPAEIFVVEEDSTRSGWHIVEGSLPERFYESRKDAYSFNEYKVVDTDGEVFVEQGIQKRLTFTPEQLEIFKTLKEILKKAEEVDIRFVWDRDSSRCIQAFNGQHVSSVLWGGDVESDRGGDLAQIKDLALYNTDFNFYDYRSDDGSDSEYLVFKPTARQLKQWKKEHPDCKD